MSINAISQASSIWSSATSALTRSPTAQGISADKPTKTDGPPPTKTDTSRSNPFQQLSSSLQSVLIQMQAGQTQGSQASGGSTSG